MNLLLYWPARLLVALLQTLPLRWVARLGRAGGALAHFLDARHRKVAIKNLTLAFGAEKSPAEIQALARENFRRLGENFCCAVKTAAMPPAAMQKHLVFLGAEKILANRTDSGPRNCVVAIGHFGNFELYARFGQFTPGFQSATTYRALRQPALNRVLQNLRTRSGCLFFERRTEAAALKNAMSGSGLLLGLLADQHAGGTGVRLPFFGRDCSTTTAPAVFALRYQCPLFTGICYRVGLARWQIEAGDEIPTSENGQPRSVEALMADVNRAYEAAIRRDPANWFWVHNRWKPANFKIRRRENPAAADAPSATT